MAFKFHYVDILKHGDSSTHAWVPKIPKDSKSSQNIGLFGLGISRLRTCKTPLSYFLAT
jgi:hypothetical protein